MTQVKSVFAYVIEYTFCTEIVGLKVFSSASFVYVVCIVHVHVYIHVHVREQIHGEGSVKPVILG